MCLSLSWSGDVSQAFRLQLSKTFIGGGIACWALGVPSGKLEDAIADMYWNYIVPSVPSVPSGMLEDAGQGHIPESLPRPRWVGQHMQAYRTTISVHTCKHTCKHTIPPNTALSFHTCTTAVHWFKHTSPQFTELHYILELLTQVYHPQHRTQHAYLHSFVPMCTESVLLIPNRFKLLEDQKPLSIHS